jgi:hypothetical protein
MKVNPISHLAILLIAAGSSFGYAGTIVVTNTNDSGAGSLRQAITEAENLPGPDSIVFNIPVSDPNYNNTTGVWTIQPATELPYLLRPSMALRWNRITRIPSASKRKYGTVYLQTGT